MGEGLNIKKSQDKIGKWWDGSGGGLTKRIVQETNQLSG